MSFVFSDTLPTSWTSRLRQRQTKLRTWSSPNWTGRESVGALFVFEYVYVFVFVFVFIFLPVSVFVRVGIHIRARVHVRVRVQVHICARVRVRTAQPVNKQSDACVSSDSNDTFFALPVFLSRCFNNSCPTGVSEGCTVLLLGRRLWCLWMTSICPPKRSMAHSLLSRFSDSGLTTDTGLTGQ